MKEAPRRYTYTPRPYPVDERGFSPVDKALAKATHTPLRRRSLWLEPVIWRYYPNRELGAHALGYILNNGKPGVHGATL